MWLKFWHSGVSTESPFQGLLIETDDYSDGWRIWETYYLPRVRSAMHVYWYKNHERAEAMSCRLPLVFVEVVDWWVAGRYIGASNVTVVTKRANHEAISKNILQLV